MKNTGLREAEKAVIAAILSNLILPEDTGLTGQEFSSLDYANIFTGAKAVRGEHGTVDANALASYLAVHCKQAEIQPPNPILLNNLAASPVPTNLLPSVKMIHQNHARKRLMDFSARLAEQVGDETETPVEIVDGAVRQLEQIRAQVGFKASNRKHISEIVPEAAKSYTELYEGISQNISTGFEMFDKATNGGGTPGDLWVLGAATGMGKSALVFEMARRQSKLGIKSLVISREMRNVENFKRVHSAVADIPHWMASKVQMYENIYRGLMETLKNVAEQTIWIDSDSADIDTACREIEAAKEEDGISVVYVDYLQLFRGISGARMSRMEEIAYCSTRLKQTAMKTGVWIVEVAQYNRSAAINGTAENHSFDGASQIEKDASVILHLELEKSEMDLNGKPKVWRGGKIRTTKGRNVPLTEFPVWYRGEVFSFTETDPTNPNVSDNERYK